MMAPQKNTVLRGGLSLIISLSLNQAFRYVSLCIISTCIWRFYSDLHIEVNCYKRLVGAVVKQDCAETNPQRQDSNAR